MSSTELSTLSSELTDPPQSHALGILDLDTADKTSRPSTRKRAAPDSPQPSHHSRHTRQPTPVELDQPQDQVLSGFLEVTQNASAPAVTTTGAEDSGSREDPTVAAVTGESDAEDGSGSKLFSDQHVGDGQPIETSRTNLMEDDAGSETLINTLDGGKAKADMNAAQEAFLVEDPEEEQNDELEESQDQNDLAEELYDEELARERTPTWMDARLDSLLGHSMNRSDLMTRVVERSGPSRRRGSRARLVVEDHDDEPLAMHLARLEENQAVLISAEGDEGYYEDEGSPRLPSSYHSGDTDEFEMDHRPMLERTAIKAACNWLHTDLWMNWDEEVGEIIYKAVDRLGEGTFSSVYLARDRFHTKFDNEYWTGKRAKPMAGDYFEEEPGVRVALKKILVTSSPVRIENELSILESLRGSRNVSQLITAFRQEDQVVIVLPYHPSDDFRHYYRHMDVSHIRSYMRCLLRGLKDIHSRGIIHRDIKPANFLYDYAAGTGAICDFGLAERYSPSRKPVCQHASATIRSLGSGKTRTSETPAVEQAVYDARKRAKLGEGRIGFLSDDKRPSIKTNRAGTRGFRAPEVLLKCPDQSFSIDIWSAGIILLSILAQKFPVFNSADDVEALMELASLFGRSALERCAMLHNRTVISNVPTLDADPLRTLSQVVLKLNPHLFTPPTPCPTAEEAKNHIEGVDQALELLHGLLRMDCTSRYSATKALQHPFFHFLPGAKRGETPDDIQKDTEAFDPVGFQEGKCGNLHGMVDGKHKAYFGDVLVDMHFGQGRTDSTDSLCPEHEHWQLRTGQNVLTSCTQFVREEEVLLVDERDESSVARRLPFGERDENVHLSNEGMEPKMKRRREA